MFDAEKIELALDDRRGAFLFETEFGKFVNLAAYGDRVVRDVVQDRADGHRAAIRSADVIYFEGDCVGGNSGEFKGSVSMALAPAARAGWTSGTAPAFSAMNASRLR